MWRKRVGVEPTIRPAKDRITGFEGRESHRTLFASENSIAWERRLVWDERPPPKAGPTKSLQRQERWEAMAAACWVRIKAATRSYSAGLVQTS
jgi:hypothetical protein